MTYSVPGRPLTKLMHNKGGGGEGRNWLVNGVVGTQEERCSEERHGQRHEKRKGGG